MKSPLSAISPATNPHYIILLWIISCLLMMIFLYYFLQVRSDISFFLPEDQSTIDGVMKHQLTQGEAGKIILIALSAAKTSSFSSASKTQASIKQLAEINKKLTIKLKQNKQFITVQNGSLLLQDLIIEPYYRYRYLLHSQPEVSFSNDSLSNSFEHLLQRLQVIPGPVEQALFADDPQMIWLNLLKQWQTQKLQKHHGVWFDQQGQQTLLFVKTRANAYDLKKQQQNIDIIKSSIDTLITAEATIKYVLTGAPVFAMASKKSISTQIKIISMIASFILMAFLYWFFRSLKIILLIGLPLSFAVLTGITCIILIDGFIHGITIAFGITIIGIAVDYPVHLYSHIIFPAHQEQPSQKTVMHSIWPLIRLGLITTLIGFSAITLSDFSGLRQLGLFAISGLLAAALVTRFMLPIIPVKSTTGSKANKHKIQTSAFKRLLFIIHYPLPKFIYSLSIALPVLALFYIVSQQDSLWQKDLSALSPVPEQQKQQDFELRKAMELPELRHALVLQAATIEEILQHSELLKPQLEQLKQQHIISGYDMANLYLPSIKYQQQQQKILPTEKELSSRLAAVLKNTPLSENAFLPFIHSVEQSKHMQPLLAQSLLSNQEQPGYEQNGSQNFISDKIKTLLFQQNNTSRKFSTNDKIWTAIIPLQGVEQALPMTTINQSVHFPVYGLDLKVQTEAMLSNYRNDALLWFFLGAILILVLLFSQYSKIADLFAVTWPFTGAVILTIASLLLMGHSLSVFHLVTLLLVIGLGIDYSIFMQYTHPESSEVLQSSEVAQVSVIICLVSTLIMFGALSLSDLPVLKAIGSTASMGALYAFLLARCAIKTQ